MTGEMTSPVDEETWSTHAKIRDLLDGELRPFDKYQGPYIRSDHGKIWLIIRNRRFFAYLYNETNEKQSERLPIRYTKNEQDESILTKESIENLKRMLTQVCPSYQPDY